MGSILLQGKNGIYSFDPFDTGALIGEGGTGRIFKGSEVHSGRAVAIKVLYKHLTQDAANIKRLRLESDIQIVHPNLVKMLDFVHDESQDIYHSISEFIEGFTLSQKLDFVRKKGETLSIDEVRHIGISVANALEALHTNKPSIIHRDVDPTNIMLCKDGTVKLMDLGIAKILEEEGANPQLTKFGSIIGKQHYLSPEQINSAGGGSLAPASDLYSLGITLYECLTGHVPFDGSSEFEIYQKHQKAKLPQDKLLSKPLYRVLVNATAKKQAHRYRTAVAFRNDLRKINADGSADGHIKLLHDSSRKWKYSAAAVAFVAIGITGLAMYHHLQRGKTITANCGNTQKLSPLSPQKLPDSILFHIKVAVAPVDSAAKQTALWKQWLNSPDTYTGRINTSAIELPPTVLHSNRNRLLMKLLLELKDVALGDRENRIDIINAIPWNDSLIIDKALNGELRVNMLIQLSDLESAGKKKLRSYVETIERLLDSSGNYALLSELYLKAGMYSRASRYALLANNPEAAERSAILGQNENHSFETGLAYANALTIQNHYNEAVNEYNKAFALFVPGQDSTVLSTTIADMEQMSARADVNVNDEFIGFVLGLLYNQGAGANAAFKERGASHFKCFIASAGSSAGMAPFVRIAKTKLK